MTKSRLGVKAVTSACLGMLAGHTAFGEGQASPIIPPDIGAHMTYEEAREYVEVNNLAGLFEPLLPRAADENNPDVNRDRARFARIATSHREAASMGLGGPPEAQADGSRLLERTRLQAGAGLDADVRLLSSEAPATPIGRPVAWRTAQDGTIEFLVSGGGRGVSQSFTKSQCLFCTSYKNQAEKMAEAGARAAVEQNCSEKKGFLKSVPAIQDVNCVRVDGWMSYYACGAQATGTCLLVLDGRGSR